MKWFDAVIYAAISICIVGAPRAYGAPNVNQHGLTGSWYEPATSGQGFELEVFPDLVAPGTALVQGAWFTYDTAPTGGVERQRWYTFAGNGVSGQSNVQVTIYRNINGNFNSLPITNPEVVGSGTLAFSDCTTATFIYSFSDGTGRTGSIPLTRLTPNVTCSAGVTPLTDSDFALSGNWFRSNISGQGIVVEINPIASIFFLTWYTYARSGQTLGATGQRWFTAQGAFARGSRSVTGPLYETTGGLFDQPTSPGPSSLRVGTATMSFVSCNSALLEYNFISGGNIDKSGATQISRIGPVPHGCGAFPPDARAATLQLVGSWKLYTADEQTLLASYTFTSSQITQGVNGWFIRAGIGAQAGYNTTTSSYYMIDLAKETGFVWEFVFDSVPNDHRINGCRYHYPTSSTNKGACSQFVGF